MEKNHLMLLNDKGKTLELTKGRYGRCCLWKKIILILRKKSNFK